MAQIPKSEAGSERQLVRERRAIERAQRGDLPALEPVLAAHAEALFALILGWLGDRTAAEEVLKDTFVAALERIGGFTWQGRSIYPWLRHIALQQLIEHHRATGHRRRLVAALRAELAENESAPGALSAEQERQQAQRRIEQTLGALHPRYAEVIRLRLCEEQPRAECAARLGVTVETFDVLLHRAVRAFRKQFGDPDAP